MSASTTQNPGEWTVLKLLTTTTEFFKKKGIPSARLDAELLMAETLRCSRVQLYTRFDQPLTPEELVTVRGLVTRRGAREPVAYLLGRKEFWSLDFVVGPGVLVPRPDTEILVEEAIKLLGGARLRKPERKALPWNAEVMALAEKAREEAATAKATEGAGQEKVIQLETEGLEPAEVPGGAGVLGGPERPGGQAEHVVGGLERKPGGKDSTPVLNDEPRLVLDLCTGSGIIPIVLARETGARCVGVDVSTEALEFARKNAERHAPSGAVALLQGDLFAPVPKRFLGRFDLLTSNPPYIPKKVLETLEPEIHKHEPALALLGGDDGLSFYRRLAVEVKAWVKPGGWVLFEVGTARQGEAVVGLLNAAGLTGGVLLKDLAQQVRVVKVQIPRS
ncbi:MAG: N5-glutamine methyltransferase family protein [Myxococcota bacterium]